MKESTVRVKSTKMPIMQTQSLNRRHPLLTRSQSLAASKRFDRTRFGEICGGATAECAAVFCCCPYGLVNLLVFAVYKVPTRLCRKALRKRRRQQFLKRGGFPQGSNGHKCNCSYDGTEVQVHPICGSMDEELLEFNKVEMDEDVLALENEMWNKFYDCGFWRSPSQTESTKAPTGLQREFSVMV